MPAKIIEVSAYTRFTKPAPTINYSSSKDVLLEAHTIGKLFVF